MQLFSANACPECYDSPTNHWSTWVDSTVSVLLSRASAPGRARSALLTSGRAVAALAKPVLSFLYTSATTLRLIVFRDEVEYARTSRSRAVWVEAKRRGIPMRQLAVLGVAGELFETRAQGARVIFQSIPVPRWYLPSEPWADDKFRMKNKFREAGIAAPLSRSVKTLCEAKRALASFGVVCVKPQSGSNGRHTFPHISTEAELVLAFYSAKKLCAWVVVEEHLEGNLARATCVDGRLVGFLESLYPTVVGNGRATVRELVEQENKHKPAGVADISLTPAHERYIARRGYTLESVLEAGKVLPLIYRAGYRSGGRNREYGTAIHPELRQEIERAARLTKLAVVGFDLIIQNPTKSPESQVWGIIEANSQPWIDLHLTPLYGAPVNVAEYIWDLWEQPLVRRVGFEPT